MLTKEECLEALTEIKMYGSINIPFYSLEVIENLIDEHFYNPPLKFDELKEGMFVWDNKHHTYIKIDRIWESYNKAIYFYVIGWECCENTEYEPNRFYRKEVQE